MRMIILAASVGLAGCVVPPQPGNSTSTPSMGIYPASREVPTAGPDGMRITCTDIDRFAAGEFDNQDVAFGVPRSQWTRQGMQFLRIKASACDVQAMNSMRQRFVFGEAARRSIDARNAAVFDKTTRLIKEIEDRHEAEARRAAALAEKTRSERAALQEAQAKQARYRPQYQSISSPDDARSFVDQYSGSYDPDNLVKGAMKKGYEAGIERARTCIAFWNKQIANQKEIGATVGYVDKTVMYQAGANLVQCKRQLAEYQAKFPR